jgi:MFS family permease
MSARFNLPELARNRLARSCDLYREYPSQFWILVGASFIDRLGGAMLFPFFTLYLTAKFGINMTTVGALFGVYSLSSVVGSTVGGAMTDRLGRKGMLLFGLVMSATSSVLMGVVDRLDFFIIVILFVGVLAEAGVPAQQALVGDLLPEEKQTEGFAILRVVFNLAVAIGPLIGGFLASRSYLLLFISDAATSIITAIIVVFTLKETWSPKERGESEQGMVQTFAGYGAVLKDSAFMWFMGVSVLMVLVYIQMNTTLAVYLRDAHGVNEQGFGYILSLNAAMVVLFQFSISRRVTRFRPLMIMTVGALIYAVGFTMYGFVSAFALFLLAMAVITVGEMLVSPVGQAIALRMAPEDMRGRYMAMFGFTWVIPFAIGPLLAGMVMDNFDPVWLWYAAGILGVISAAGFALLEWWVGRSRLDKVDQRLRILQQVEDGLVTAEHASVLLQDISDGSWGRMALQAEAAEARHIRFRLHDLESGELKTELRLPLGLVNTTLQTGGQLAAALAGFDPAQLRRLVSLTTDDHKPQCLEHEGERLEVVVD